mgnify:CR=1 FL=1
MATLLVRHCHTLVTMDGARREMRDVRQSLIEWLLYDADPTRTTAARSQRQHMSAQPLPFGP